MANLQTNAKLPEDLILKEIFPSFQITVACDSDIFAHPNKILDLKFRLFCMFNFVVPFLLSKAILTGIILLKS